MAHCLALIRTDVRAKRAAPALIPAGYGPASLQSAYKLPSATAGGGRTVAIVDAFGDPNAAADLNAYRAQHGLPACSAGCFTKVNQNGQASPLPPASGSTGWATEESLDIDMVSAVCPNCHILPVEANSPTTASLGTAVNSAVTLGAKYVSNNYGEAELASDPSTDASFYNHPGVAVTASSGDAGFGVEFPAASPHVVAVGGTSLTQASNSRGWSETAWAGAGAGCSSPEPKPSGSPTQAARTARTPTSPRSLPPAPGSRPMTPTTRAAGSRSAARVSLRPSSPRPTPWRASPLQAATPPPPSTRTPATSST